MKQATEQHLRTLLEQHDRAYLKKLEIEHDWVVESADFDRKFEKLRTDVIKPVMEDFHDLLEEHGLKSQIAENDRVVHSDGKVKPASIAFEYLVHADAEYQGMPGTTPALSFISEAGLGKVLIHEESMLPFVGGHIGIIDERRLDEVTSDLVEKHLLALSEKILRGTDVS
jgi:hypothetical protein